MCKEHGVKLDGVRMQPLQDLAAKIGGKESEKLKDEHQEVLFMAQCGLWEL